MVGIKQLFPKKYRAIVYAVAFFLVFDLGVLVLNFYTSYQISADAVAINLAGRQRMLSQRMTKAILTINEDLRNGADIAPTFKELKTTVGLFDGTLNGFERGAEVVGSDGKPVVLQAVESAAGRDLLRQAREVWQPYLTALQPMFDHLEASPAPTPVPPAISADAPPFATELTLSPDTSPAEVPALASAVAAARMNNLKLLDLMNRFTGHLEQLAKLKADRLRLVQTVGISLALINFGFILFHFLRQLRASDQKIEAAQRETAEILDTVQEGLFLLDADGRIGGQFSASLKKILRREVSPGDDLFALLKGMAPDATLKTAKSYIEVLFSNRVRERLVGDLNPLNRLELLVEKPSGGYETRYLDMHFNRVLVDGKISHLLVTVADITERVRLEKELAAVDRRAKTESEMLAAILRIEPADLAEFLTKTEIALLEGNDLLKRRASGHADYLPLVNALFRTVHSTKGEAAALGLESIELMAHEFELKLAELRGRDDLTGDDLLPLPIHLNDLLEHVSQVREVMERAAELLRAGVPTTGQADGLEAEFKRLASRIAVDQRKQVKVVTELSGFERLPASVRRTLKELAIQLVRNAVYHGIELPDERARYAKPQEGTVRLTMQPLGDSQFEFVVRDDGRGLAPQRIREALLATGRYRAQDLNALDERVLLTKIFEPGVSTAAGVDRDAGHGVGLDIVKDRLASLRAQLKLDSQPGRFTEFRIRFAA